MGAYDSLWVKYPLHKGLEKDGDEYREFQTKSFDIPYQNSYEIDKNGNLLQLIKGKYPIFCQYTDTLNFYGFLDKENCQGWVEFDAEFVDGKLQSVKLVELVNYD
jgi:hypothetical protein